MSELLEVLHIAGAVFIVGPMVILPMFALRAIRVGDGTQVRLLASSALGFGIATIIVAVLGFGVMAMDDADRGWSVTTPWILGSVVAVAAACAVHLGIVVPALYRADGERGEGFSYALIATTSGLVAVLMVIVVVLMVVRPG